jgi:hypothetical protein
MEAEGEPEQKRLRRIAEHLEDEIDRAFHFPLEEFIAHKSAMIHMLQFLTLEEAYRVSLASQRIYEWFQRNDIWYALAVKWLSPARLAQCEQWVAQVKPKGKRVNYLWLLLAEFVHSTFSDTFPDRNTFDFRLTEHHWHDYVRILPYSMMGSFSQTIWQIFFGPSNASKGAAALFGTAARGDHTIFEHDMTELLFKGTYRVFLNFPKARLAFRYTDYNPAYIRNKLN